MFKNSVLALIKVYQKTLSLDHSWLAGFSPGGFCKFYPTCSQYTYQAISKYGVIKGMVLGFYRILRCNPWGKGGPDPVR